MSNPPVRVLLTFTGFHDPFTTGAVPGDEQEGPILGLLRACPMDYVVLFSTPRTVDITDKTRSEIERRFPGTMVECRHLELEDPTDYFSILIGLRRHYSELCSRYPSATWFIGTASGTPQMHASWVLLAASGEIPAQLLQAHPRRFLAKEHPGYTEADFHRPEFPTVRARDWTGGAAGETEGKSVSEAVARLGLVGDHPAFTRAIETAALLAESEVPVLVSGESGTGKEAFAGLIHHLSRRGGGPFVAVNCAAIPRELAESVLFGHMRGAFTGATRDQKGRFELAHGGSLFLDELGELPLELQPKLLRALQSGVIEPVGAQESRHLSVRVIAATNRDLLAMVQEGSFREDLYYRVNVGELRLPALRERRSDIVKIAVAILDRANLGRRRPKVMAPEALAALQGGEWPGNVRQLANVVERAVLLAKGDVIRLDDLALEAIRGSEKSLRIPEPYMGFRAEDYLGELRRQLFQRALDLAKNNQSEAARMLGVSPQAVSRFSRER